MFANFFNSFDRWASRRVWFFYLPLFLVMLFLFYQMVGNEGHMSLFSGINLGIHEMGHLLVCFREGTFCSAGGSLLQIFAPVLSVFILLRGSEFFGVPFCGLWLASNFYEISVYMADARAMDLPLVSVGGGDVAHDWNVIFGNLGLLSFDQFVAHTIEFLAFLLAASAIFLYAYMLYRMRKLSL